MEEEKTEFKNSLLEQGEAIAKRIEDANKKAEELYNKNVEVLNRMRLGGETGANIQPVKKEETPKEYTERIMKGA